MPSWAPERRGPPVATYESSGVGVLSDSSQEEFVRALNETIRRTGFRFLVVLAAPALGALLVLLRAGPLAFIELLFYAVIAFAVAHGVTVRRRTFLLVYDLDERAKRDFEELRNALTAVGAMGALRAQQMAVFHGDWKRHGGATIGVDLRPARISPCKPRYIITNVPTIALSGQGKDFFFFPDRLLVYEHGRYAAIAYGAIRVDWSTVSFRWDGYVPRDAEVIGQTWQYVRKDGGPDRRFNNNRQIPILRMGELDLETDTGLKVKLLGTNRDAMLRLCRQLESYGAATRGEVGVSAAALPAEVRNALSALGLSEVPPQSALKAHFHALARRNHPDTFAGSAPEIIVFAEERMKEINAAFLLLRPLAPLDVDVADLPEHMNVVEAAEPAQLGRIFSPHVLAVGVWGCLTFRLLGLVVPPFALPTLQETRVDGESSGVHEERLVTTQSCNLRDGPSTSTLVIGSVSAGSRVVVLEDQRGWRRVRTQRADGWLAPLCFRRQE